MSLFERRPGFYRAGMLSIAIPQGLITAWALIDPRSFHDDFPPGGSHWVDVLGPYNEHMMYDYGSFTLTGVVALLLASFWLERRAVQLALIAWGIGNTPHLVYHLTTLDVYGTGDDLANSFGLAAYVIVPALLLVGTRRNGPATVEATTSERG